MSANQACFFCFKLGGRVEGFSERTGALDENLGSVLQTDATRFLASIGDRLGANLQDTEMESRTGADLGLP